MSTVFIAVQCCQCSTMQVKQRNKSNKWTCIVCNQKQTVRQVFAQGLMARDLHLFVQSSNMSRQFAQQTHDQQQQQQQQEQDARTRPKTEDETNGPSTRILRTVIPAYVSLHLTDK